MTCFIRKCRKNKIIPKLVYLQFISITILVITLGTLLNIFNTSDYPIDDVKFIAKNDVKINQYINDSHKKLVRNENINKFFIKLSPNITRHHTTKLCYKEGTEWTQRASHDDTKTDFSTNQTDCLCHPEWHGIACSIPEIIWRAFINPRQTVNHAPKVITKPNAVIYVVNKVSRINLETLEMQIMELVGVVNFFILCEKSINSTLASNMNHGFFHKHREITLLLNDGECSGKFIYSQLKSTLGNDIKPMDIIIIGGPNEILNRKSIEFLKWHKNEWLHVLTFRLKWNVYGFFFQHPDKTITRTRAIHYQLLEYLRDFDHITSSSQNTFIVGDLNHYGGWYCEFCNQVSDIVNMINHEKIIKSHNHLSPVINKEFVENLIKSGKYVDGKKDLIKQHNYDDDKYFLPKTARNNRWKFENIITNYYGRLVDDIDDDY